MLEIVFTRGGYGWDVDVRGREEVVLGYSGMGVFLRYVREFLIGSWKYIVRVWV